MRDLRLPDLTFPMLNYGKFETPLTLLPMLYLGGAGTKTNLVAHYIDQGALGEPIVDRIPIIEKLHGDIEARLVGGGSRGSARTTIVRFREFVAWADRYEKSVTLATVEETYIDWSHYLLQRQRRGDDVSRLHIYQSAVAVAKVLDNVLELRTGLLAKTPLRRSNYLKPFLSVKADKQNLEQTFAFGQALLDITAALSSEVIRGPIPVRIHFRTGQVIEEWLKLKSTEHVKTLSDKVKPSTRQLAIAKRASWLADTSMRTRHSLANLRIEAEMLIFIAQTGMNLEQVNTLKLSKFRYRSHLDGYQVHRVYKGRRQGEVAFDIFSQYRETFERYLMWRASMFPDDDEGLLFPLVRAGRAEGRGPAFTMVKKMCKKLAIRFIPSRVLRKTRINWLLRRSNDPSLTAEMHAHTQETLIRHYEQPSLQVAMVEINRFHARTDQAIASPGPGVCAEVGAIPQAVPDTASDATPPDCISPAGCLFCWHQRDIDTEEYVWSLASYRYLKSLELARFRPPAKGSAVHPAAAAIDRLTAKLKHFESSSQVRRGWVQEALIRVDEDYHHPRWDGFIRLMDARI